MNRLMKVLLIVTMSIPAMAVAQKTELSFPIDSVSHTVNYSEVIVANRKKEQLYKNAQKWVTETYSDYKAAVQSENPPDRLVVRGTFSLNDIIDSKIRYDVTIDVKDSKYRYQITNIQSGFKRMDGTYNWTPIERLIEVNKTLPADLKKSSTDKLLQYNSMLLSLIPKLKSTMNTNDDF